MLTRIYVSGRVRVEHERIVDEAHLPGSQGRLLLAVLASTPGPVSRARLGALIWSPDDAHDRERSLRPLLSKLRTALAASGNDELLIAGSGAVELRRGSDTWIDVEHAVGRLDAAEGAARKEKYRNAWVEAAVATSILRRPFLPGLDNEWADERRRLHADLLVRAYAVIVDVWLALGDPDQAVAAATRLVAVDPYRETSYERLIRAHVAAGNNARAVQAFAELETRLRDELGLVPSPAAQRAYETALTGNGQND